MRCNLTFFLQILNDGSVRASQSKKGLKKKRHHHTSFFCVNISTISILFFLIDSFSFGYRVNNRKNYEPGPT